MRSPCHRCGPLHCVLGDRKKDCLEYYQGLRRIGNSPEGFKGTSYAALDDVPLGDRAFYDRMTGDGEIRDLL